ncbi:divalent cation transporter [Phaeobacter sp. J2-8]|uniref:ZIP family metal transporter n=1 Tax=Phaeobacter sp. J2-8 TaxID=2931394 RepID=UPI001FCFA306|nr:divalent cation transporter [Phaeobacter sp. J2-8]
MEGIVAGLILAALAGASIPVGAVLAALEDRLKPQWQDRATHTVAAFGGGALFSAIAFVLLPEAIDRLSAVPLMGLFLAGGLVFYGVDAMLSRMGGGGAQFLAMMLDYVPEAMALGALVVGRADVAMLTAGLIALQNVPEGFSAYREMIAAGHASRNKLLLLFALMVPVGPAAAAMGFFVLADVPAVLGGVMAFASGGILYLLFQDVAPQAKLGGSGGPPLGAVAGFALGLAGHLATL